MHEKSAVFHFKSDSNLKFFSVSNIQYMEKLSGRGTCIVHECRSTNGARATGLIKRAIMVCYSRLFCGEESEISEPGFTNLLCAAKKFANPGSEIHFFATESTVNIPFFSR